MESDLKERDIAELEARLKAFYWWMTIIAQRTNEKAVKDIAEKALARDKEMRG